MTPEKRTDKIQTRDLYDTESCSALPTEPAKPAGSLSRCELVIYPQMVMKLRCFIYSLADFPIIPKKDNVQLLTKTNERKLTANGK